MYSYLARQPILNLEQQTVAYELLFRDGESNSFPNVDPNQATSQILTNNHLNLGVEKITGDLPAYINFHDDSLVKHFPFFLDPKKVVIEILEDVTINDSLIKACKALKEKGYKLALDDHDLDEKWDVFLPFIDIIKVDVLSVNLMQISRFVQRIADYRITLLAEKVETLQQFNQLKMLGFSLFQGYFFAKPELVKQKKIASTKKNILALIAQASQETLDFDAIGATFSRDLGLTYKLLRFINSPAYATSKEITSLKHALVYLGELELKKFIALLAVANLNEDKPTEIVRLSLVRAKFCESISRARQDPENPPKAFLTGMLSLIDGMLDHDIDSVMAILPIHQDIKQALVTKENDLSHYLGLALALEQGQWQPAEQMAQKLSLSQEFCFDSFEQAIVWADQMLASQS
jgi:c-di-GMP-related signal transduction protein